MGIKLQATKHGLKRIEERSPIKDRTDLLDWLKIATVRAYKGSLDNKLYLVTAEEYYNPDDKRPKEDKYVYVFGANKKLVTIFEKDNYLSIRIMFKRGINIFDVKDALDYLFGGDDKGR